MKIVICTDRLTKGGAERVASLWMKGFVSMGHDVYAILGDSYEPRTYKIPETVKVYDVNPHIPNHKLRYLWMMIDRKFKLRKLKKVLQSIQPDLVVAVLPSWGPLIYAAKGDLDFKVVGTDHNAYELPNNIQMSKKQEFLKFEFNKRFDKVTVLTEADKLFIGNRLDNVAVLPNPLTFDIVDAVPPKKKIVMAAGRFDVWYVKGFDILVKAWGMVSPRHPDWILQIVGTATKKENSIKIKDFIAAAKVQNTVKLPGFCSNIKALYQEASIFVLSSRYEGFGMVLTEAMSQGCACIACDFKGRQSEIIRDSMEGITCPPGDVKALAEAIEEMISNDDYRLQVQHQSIVRSRDFSLDNIMKKWDVIIKSI